MVVFYPTIPAFLLPWIPEQHLYFVGTAPLARNGHVNLSPKCMRGTFHVESESRVWYEDLTGSGACLGCHRILRFLFAQCLAYHAYIEYSFLDLPIYIHGLLV
jgi:hypothetical protein